MALNGPVPRTAFPNFTHRRNCKFKNSERNVMKFIKDTEKKERKECREKWRITRREEKEEN
jgi:hypothetical protein